MVVLTTTQKLKISYQINYISHDVNALRFIENMIFPKLNISFEYHRLLGISIV